MEQCIQLCKENSEDALLVKSYVLKGKILWQLNRNKEGNIAFWNAYNIDKKHQQVKEFIEIISKQIEEYKIKAEEKILLG